LKNGLLRAARDDGGDRGDAGPKSTFKKQKFFASFFQKRSALPYFSEFD
jgi:hypothetical protein